MGEPELNKKSNIHLYSTLQPLEYHDNVGVYLFFSFSMQIHAYYSKVAILCKTIIHISIIRRPVSYDTLNPTLSLSSPTDFHRNPAPRLLTEGGENKSIATRQEQRRYAAGVWLKRGQTGSNVTSPTERPQLKSWVPLTLFTNGLSLNHEHFLSKPKAMKSVWLLKPLSKKARGLH